MKISRWYLLLLLPVALVGLLFFVGVFLAVIAYAPPAVTAASFVLLAVVVLWLVFGRRRASSILAGSETSLMGRQSSKEGLL